MTKAAIVAEPYGKAAFETALASKTLPQWTALLAFLSAAVQTPECQTVLANPNVTQAQRLTLIKSLADQYLDDQSRNFIALLAERKRLKLLPAIADNFQEHLREHEKTTAVTLTSAQPLSAETLRQFEKVLTKRVGEQVSLNVLQNPDLLAGAIVQIGDQVIDGSLQGKLSKMATELVG